MSSTAEKIERGFSAFWRFLTQYWNMIAAPIAAVGYLASTFFPKKVDPAPYLDLGIVAILLTLIEIKILLKGDRRRSSQFENLRAAAPAILSCMREQMTRGHDGELQIQIFGSRLLTAANMVRGILAEVADRSLRTHNVKFTVYCLDPSFATSCDTPAYRGESNENPARYAQSISAAIADLEAFNERAIFKSDHVKVEMIKYKTFPFLYAFLIGDQYLYFGAITWSDQLGDFEGSGNICYGVGRNDPVFHKLKQYLENRGAFYRRCSTAEVEHRRG